MPSLHHPNLKKISLLPIATALLLAGCGDSNFDPGIVTGFYSKGPVEGAMCQLVAVNDPANPDDDEAITEPVESVDGVAVFADVTYDGPVYMSCSGGSYIDEATGLQVVMGDDMVMRSTIGTYSTESNMIATPLSEIAYRRAEEDGDVSDIDTEMDGVIDEFGLSEEVDGSTWPTPLECLGQNVAAAEAGDAQVAEQTGDVAEPSGAEEETIACPEGTAEGDEYGVVLAALSQMMLDENVGSPPTATALRGLISKLEQRIEEGSPSAKGIANALENVTRNPHTNFYIQNTGEIVEAVGRGNNGNRPGGNTNGNGNSNNNGNSGNNGNGGNNGNNGRGNGRGNSGGGTTDVSTETVDTSDTTVVESDV